MAKDERGNTYISEAQSKARSKWEDRKKAKIEAREERQYARANRTDEEQLARLDMLLGEGIGATRERARLIKRIAKRKEEAKAKKEKAEKKEQVAAAKERKASKSSN